MYRFAGKGKLFAIGVDSEGSFIIAVVRTIEARVAGEAASCVMQRIGDVFRFAVMTERIERSGTVTPLSDEYRALACALLYENGYNQ